MIGKAAPRADAQSERQGGNSLPTTCVALPTAGRHRQRCMCRSASGLPRGARPPCCALRCDPYKISPTIASLHASCCRRVIAL